MCAFEDGTGSRCPSQEVRRCGSVAPPKTYALNKASSEIWACLFFCLWISAMPLHFLFNLLCGHLFIRGISHTAAYLLAVYVISATYSYAVCVVTLFNSCHYSPPSSAIHSSAICSITLLKYF